MNDDPSPVLANVVPDAPGRKTGKRTRLSATDREAQIVEEAIRYFAEVGFTGQTRELALRAGVANASLFKYFPTKDDLINRVYDRVYLGRWHPEWEDIFRDRSVSIAGRLEKFYSGYFSAIYNYEWIRIFFFAGLRGVSINKRYLDLLEKRVVHVVGAELRVAFSLPDVTEIPLSALELDAIWGLQGQILYIGVRKFIYSHNIRNPQDLVKSEIDIFMAGIPQLMRDRIQSA